METPPEHARAADQKPHLLNVRILRQLLIFADDILHFAVAVILLVCAAMILVQTVPNLFHGGGIRGLLHVLNDVLLVLIIMELLWPIVRFLKRQPFKLNSFLYIGMISSLRRILLLEAEHSVAAKATDGHVEWSVLLPVIAEVGVNVLVILLLAVALRLLSGHQSDD